MQLSIHEASMWIDVASMWHRCGIDVASMWHRCSSNVDRCGIDVALKRIDVASMHRSGTSMLHRCGIDVAIGRCVSMKGPNWKGKWRGKLNGTKVKYKENRTKEGLRGRRDPKKWKGKGRGELKKTKVKEKENWTKGPQEGQEGIKWRKRKVSIWHRCWHRGGIDVASMWHRCGIDVASMLHRCGSMEGPIWKGRGRGKFNGTKVK